MDLPPLKLGDLQQKISAITFDVGGTLIEPWPSVGHVYADVAAQHGYFSPAPQVLNTRFRSAWRACRRFDYTRDGWARLVQQTFESDAELPFFDALYQRFTESAAWRVFEDVTPTLESLACARVRLAVISNWDERLRLLLQRLNLDRYFETLVISCEVGSAKPDRTIFDHALQKLGVPAGEILHVGDSLEMDVKGARQAGFQALLLDRFGKSQPGSIRSLSELQK